MDYVTKEQVEIFKIGEQTYTKEEATKIYEALAELLGKPKIDFKGCDDKMSHGPHMWSVSAVGGKSYYCRGLRFDRT